MASEIEIYNLALTNVSAKSFVESPTEDSKERKFCSANFAQVVGAVLEDHDWNFASAYKTLALTSDDAVSPWVYQYGYPSDCIAAREIMRATDNEEVIAFRVDLDSAGTGKVIHTDRSQAVLRYTKRVLTPGLFSEKAVDAIGWKLATRIALPLTGSREILQYTQDMYLQSLAEAKAGNFNESSRRVDADPLSIQARS